MELYFYFLNEQTGEIDERAVEVVKTAKTYKTAAGDPFPETRYRRYSHDDAEIVHKHMHSTGNFYYMSESRDMEAAKKTFRGYFRYYLEQAQKEAQRWEKRLASVS